MSPTMTFAYLFWCLCLFLCYRWSDENNQGGYVNQGWYLMNKLQGIKQSITQEQAQTPEQRSQGYSWKHFRF